MNTNGYRIRPKTEASEYQKRIDQIDTVILCMAEAERLVAGLGRTLVEGLNPSAHQTVSSRGSKTPAWEGVGCFYLKKRGYTYMVGRLSREENLGGTGPTDRKIDP